MTTIASSATLTLLQSEGGPHLSALLSNIAIATALAVVVGLAVWAAWHMRRRSRQVAQAIAALPTVEDNLQWISDVAQQMRSRLQSVETELAARENKAKELAQRAEQYNQMATLTREQVEAVRVELIDPVHEHLVEIAKGGLRTQWLFFAIGAIVSALLSIPVSLLTR